MKRCDVGFRECAGGKFLLRRGYCCVKGVACLFHARNGEVLRFFSGNGVVHLEFAEVESHARGLGRHESVLPAVARFHCRGVFNDETEIFVRVAVEIDGR